MSNYKIISLDLDGTLLKNDMSVSRGNIEAAKRLTEKGMHIVPNTGRTYGEIPEEIKDNSTFRYLIYSNGAVTLDKSTGEKRYACMPHDLAVFVFDTLREYDTEILVHIDGNSYVDSSTFNTERYVSEYHMSKNFATIIDQKDIKSDNFTDFCHSANKIEMFCCFFRHESELKECIKRLDASDDILITSSESNNIEIIYKDAGKGKALSELAEKLGVNEDETVAVGDSKNDIDMLINAGVGLATANAVPELKAEADGIICSNEDDVLVYIEKTPKSEAEKAASDEAVKKNLKNRKTALGIVLAVLLIIPIISFVIGLFGKESVIKVGYAGSHTWDSWTGTYSLLDGEMKHTIRTDTGKLHISVKTEKGEIDIEITDTLGNVIFDKDNIGNENFEIDANEKIHIKIEADKHTGSFVIGE